jgi:hypothetical protein
VKTFICLTVVTLLTAFNWHDAFADTPQSPLKAPPLQEWQVRRAELDHAIIGARKNDPDALKQFDQILTEMEKHPHDRTPLEVLDVIGTYYMPNEGIEKSLTVTVTQLVLGWYDVLRFASPSGRAEVIDNEQFFMRAIALSGKDSTDKSFKFLNDHQDQVSQLVAKGVMYAEQFRDAPSYDRQWPTAYGMERMLCASGDAEKCKARPSLPKDQWDAAWVESKKAVTDYFVTKH